MIGDLTPLGRLRRRAGFATVKDLALHLGRKQNVVWRWEVGQQEPRDPADRSAYAEALGISVGRLGKLVYEQSAVVA